MTRTGVYVVFACLLLAAGVALRATTAQDRTQQPGQPTQGKVWIENRGEAQAVPVNIQSMASEALPLRVQLVGTPTVAIGAANAPVRGERQPWEYRDVTISPGQDLIAVLNAAGADGWETTGVAVPVPGGTLVVMKRPR